MSSFEEWEPAEARYDLVIAATSFHWVDPAMAYVKSASVATTESRNVGFPCSEDFARFFDQELAVWLEQRSPVGDAPSDWCVVGSSLGGLAATWLGFRVPQRIGNVISQGGSFWWGPGWNPRKSPMTDEYERMWLVNQITSSKASTTRFWIEVGKLEHSETQRDPRPASPPTGCPNAETTASRAWGSQVAFRSDSCRADRLPALGPR